MRKNFHETALESILFKGRSDWYFCYLKSEKIAFVLAVLAQKSSNKTEDFSDLLRLAGNLPHSIAHFAAGEMEPAVVLADVFSLLSSVRVAGMRGLLVAENAHIIAEEYEHIAEKIAAENRPSPFVTPQDLSVPELPERDKSLSLTAPFSEYVGAVSKKTLKDIYKGHVENTNKGQAKNWSDRMQKILDFVKAGQGVSIKDIANVVRDCSEKTIQRELNVLIEQGRIYREGERRWSVYKATPEK